MSVPATATPSSVWMDYCASHHYDLFVTRQDGQRQVMVRRRIGNLVADVSRVSIEPGPITLMIQAMPDRYTFGVTGKSGDQQILATGETRYLAPEVAGLFTGVFFALYASGAAATAPVFFEWFDYCVAAQGRGDGIEPERMNVTLFGCRAVLSRYWRIPWLCCKNCGGNKLSKERSSLMILGCYPK